MTYFYVGVFTGVCMMFCAGIFFYWSRIERIYSEGFQDGYNYGLTEPGFDPDTTMDEMLEADRITDLLREVGL